MKLGVSVVVCTFNGAKLLPATINHIAKQQVRPDINWEVIVVDNASTDNSSNVAVTEWRKYQLPVSFTLLHQPKQGLTYARELAIKNARYEFILFCDDDNWLAPDYINIAYDLMLKHPSIGVLGGCGELEFEGAPPLWAVGLSSFASGPQASASGKVKKNAVYGAGFVMRKSAFNTIAGAGYKPMLTDRLAKNLSAGGDYELCYAIALAGYDIWYDNSLRFKHFMPENRVNWDYCTRLYREGAQSLEVLIPYRIRVNMECSNVFLFNFKILKTYLSQTRKLLPLLFRDMLLEPESDEKRVNTLRIIALKASIMSLKNYPAMKSNFIKIIKFEQERLKPFLNTKAVAYADTKNLDRSTINYIY